MLNRSRILFVFCIWCIDNSHQKPKRCLQPLKQGMCLALFYRFYYDTNSKSCVKFVYGGCGGNDNNFGTLTDCENKCVKENTGNHSSTGARCLFAFCMVLILMHIMMDFL